MLLLVDQYSSGTVTSQTIHMSRELFMLPQWHVKTHNITYSSQLIVYLDLELVENHFFCYFGIDPETIRFKTVKIWPGINFTDHKFNQCTAVYMYVYTDMI